MTDLNIVWAPQAGSQALALSAPCDLVIYEGTRGPGKTDTQLMRFRRNVGVGYGPFQRGIIFDREYKNLEDLITKSKRWFSKFGDGAKFTGGGGGGRWRWPGGEELFFRQFKSEDDYWKYHGHEYTYIGWNEMTKYPTSAPFDLMMSCNRSSFIPEEHPLPDGSLLPDLPLEVFVTTNSLGPGHNWVKRRFIDVAEPGQIVRRHIDVFNPRTQRRERITKTQVRIFGSYKENRYLSPEYIAELEAITDDNKRRAWLFGDWDITAGGAFDDLWGPHMIVPRFKVPASWRVDRSFDWGSSHPFSVGWWAEANGEEIKLPNGSTFSPPKGSLIRIAEWYGTKEIGSNQGLRMSSGDIAKGILDREAKMRAEGWIVGPVRPGPADNQIGDMREADVDTIANKMAKAGVSWTKSDKSGGSRVIGMQLARDMMEATKRGDRESRWIMVTNNCKASIATIPVLPTTDLGNDVDTDAEDHQWDEWRYRILALPRIAVRSNLLTRG